MKTQFSPAARQDVLDAAAWYLAEGGAPAAERLEEDLQRAVRLLAAMPRLGRVHREAVRTWPLKRFPFLLVYRLQGDVLTVVASRSSAIAIGWPSTGAQPLSPAPAPPPS